MTRPGRLTTDVDRLKWVAEATPPPIEIWLADVEIVPPPGMAVDAMIVTGPAVLPLWRITDALPLTVDADATCDGETDPI